MPDNVTQLNDLYDRGMLQEAWHLYLETSCQDPAWHILGCKIAFSLNLLHAARTAVERALDLGPVGDQNALAHYRAGEVNRRIGDLTVAREQFSACLHALEAAPAVAPVLRGPCLYNMALALSSSGLPEEALKASAAAIVEFDREKMTDFLRMALQNDAWYALDQGLCDRAESDLNQAEPLCHTAEDRYKQDVIRVYLAHSRVNETEALELAKSLLTDWEEGKGVPGDIAARAAAVSAEIALNQGSVDRAAALASYAYDLTWRNPQDRRCMTFVARLLSKINQAKQKGA